MLIRILNYICLLSLVVIAGCGGSSLKVDVIVQGEGLIVSDPKGIECGSDSTLCSADIDGSSVTLTAIPPSDASYVFSRWEGSCTGTLSSCEVSENANITAIFVPADGASNLPSKPRGLSVSAMSSKLFLIRWSAATDLVTPQPELQYRIYLSEDVGDITNQANVVAIIQGSEAQNYSHDLDVFVTGVVSVSGSYSIAMTALDSDGFESEPTILSNLSLMEKDLKLVGGIILVVSDEAGLPEPNIEEAGGKSVYTYTEVSSASIPNLGDYIAQSVEEQGIQFYEILKVNQISGSGFSAEPVPISEITTTPVISSSSIKVSVDQDQEKSSTDGVQINNQSSGVRVSPDSVDCGSNQDISKVSITAEKGLAEPQLEFKFGSLDSDGCSRFPDLCDNEGDYFRLIVEASPRLIAKMNLNGGECFHSETIVDSFDKDYLDFKVIEGALKGLRIRPGKVRLHGNIVYMLDATAESKVDLSTELKVTGLGFVADLEAEKEPILDMLTPNFSVKPSVNASGSLNYSVTAAPSFTIEMDGKFAGLEYGGTFETTFDGEVSARSISNITPTDVYLDTYSLDASQKYVHTLTPTILIVGFDAFTDEIAYESEQPVPIFGLPSTRNVAFAETNADDETCLITYQYVDGANNPLEQSPFEHYLLFEDLSEIPLGTPVSVTKADGVTSYAYEFSQSDLYNNYISIAKDKAYKRIAKGESLIGETVVDNTEFKKF